MQSTTVNQINIWWPSNWLWSIFAYLIFEDIHLLTTLYSDNGGILILDSDYKYLTSECY